MEATERGRHVQAAILCACSSAAPKPEDGTTGMAQWLVYPKRALAAVGFRGPVEVKWALRFVERLFERVGAGDALEARGRSSAR